MRAPTEPLDRELLVAWSAGDKRAGHALYRRHREPLARFLFNKVGDDAADLLQKTFMAAQTSAASYRGEGSARAWLLGIAYRHVCQHLRVMGRPGGGFNDELQSVMDQGASPTTLIGRHQQHRVLLEALRRLPLALQAVIELYYWEERTPSDPNPATRRAFGSNSTGSLGVPHWLPVLPSPPACAP